jgi:hypothetical protein
MSIKKNKNLHMNAVNFKLRKMSLIEYLMGIQDETLFKKVENSIQESLKSVKPEEQQFTKEMLVERAEISNNQIKKGFVVNQKDIEQQSENW